VVALPRPDLPDGPVRTLFDELHELHHRAGWPSLREIAKEVGCSHTTVSVAFSGPRVPRWGTLELIVEALRGDTERFHGLWLAATGAGAPIESPAPTVAVSPAAVPPRDLPPDVAGFTGRAGSLAALDRLLDSAGDSSAVTIVAVSGTAGVGKTALAVHWAHRVADRFPDGQLYVDLRGYDPDTPVQPIQALETFLRELGVSGAAIPAALPERAARYRTLLAGKRMLVVLDNARSVEQVRDLLPGTAHCFVVVTSRDTLPALVARHGAARVNLDLLPPAEAVALLRRLTDERADTEAGAAVELAERCARLPLALRIAAEIAVARPSEPLSELGAELGDETRLLDLLDAGEDEYTAIRAVFSWSYRNLAPGPAETFTLLGLHPGRGVEAGAVAALTATDRATARRNLDALARAHLVEPLTGDRHAMHDLLRAYAAERAAESGAELLRAALHRLVDHYVDGAVAAADAAFGAGRGDPDAAARGRAWLDAERENLVAIAEAAATGAPERICRLSVALGRYLDSRALFLDALTLHGRALQASRAAGLRAYEGDVLNLLAVVYRRLGRYPQAQRHHQEALAVHRAADNPAGVAASLRGLGILHWRLGRYTQARDDLHQALTVFEEQGNVAEAGTALYNLGIVYRRLGRYTDSLAHYQRAIDIFREIGDRNTEGGAVNNIGIVYLRLGRYDDAEAHFTRALAIHREMGDRTSEAVALTNLGTVAERTGDLERARAYQEQALTMYRRAGYRVGEGDASHGLGVVRARLGDTDQALEHLRHAVAIGRELGEADIETKALTDMAGVLGAAGDTEAADEAYQRALALAHDTGDRYELARALDGLAILRHAHGDTAGARQHWRRALDIYTQLRVPEADEVHGKLSRTSALSDPAQGPR
jgi:tetratricopeptide (TPR) repeat protein